MSNKNLFESHVDNVANMSLTNKSTCSSVPASTISSASNPQLQQTQQPEQTHPTNSKAAFTPAELSRMYGIPYSAVKRLAAEGQVPSFKVGARTYIMIAQFEKFLSSHGMASASSSSAYTLSSDVTVEATDDVQNDVKIGGAR